MPLDATVGRGGRITPIVTALVLSMFLSTGSSAQERPGSPFEAVSRSQQATWVTTHSTGDHIPTRALQPVALESTARASSGRVVAGALLGSAGSLGLMYAGAFTGGVASGDDYDGSQFTALILGAATGSIVGSTLGSFAVVGHPEKALFGSVAGGLFGILAALGVSSLGHDSGAILAYSLVQGTTAALVAGR
jgi:hypothetical protein